MSRSYKKSVKSEIKTRNFRVFYEIENRQKRMVLFSKKVIISFALGFMVGLALTTYF